MMSTTPDSAPESSAGRSWALRLAFVGTLCIFGGELFCLLGPLQYQRLVHMICHVVFYGGVALVAVAAGLRVTERLRSRQ